MVFVAGQRARGGRKGGEKKVKAHCTKKQLLSAKEVYARGNNILFEIFFF